jgi:malate dehydrogenase
METENRRPLTGPSNHAPGKSPLFADHGIDFFSSNVELGVDGIAKIHPIGPISAQEQKLLDACLPELKKNIDKGKAFVA